MNTYIQLAVVREFSEEENVEMARQVFSGEMSSLINTMFNKIEKRGIPASLFKATKTGDALSHIAQSAKTIYIGKGHVSQEHMADFLQMERFWKEASCLFVDEKMTPMELIIHESIWSIVANWIDQKVPVNSWDLNSIFDAIGVPYSSFHARVGAEYLALIKVFLLDWNKKFQSK